jgi:hypothetical protein
VDIERSPRRSLFLSTSQGVSSASGSGPGGVPPGIRYGTSPAEAEVRGTFTPVVAALQLPLSTPHRLQASIYSRGAGLASEVAQQPLMVGRLVRLQALRHIHHPVLEHGIAVQASCL